MANRWYFKKAGLWEYRTDSGECLAIVKRFREQWRVEGPRRETLYVDTFEQARQLAERRAR